MNHGLENNIPVLRRWAAHSDGALPPDWHTYSKANLTKATLIAQRDPELVALLSGKASADLRADALTGKLSAVPPDVEQRERQAAFDRQQEVIKRLESGEATMTDHLILQKESPQDYQRLQAKHGPTSEYLQEQERQRAISQNEARISGLEQTMLRNRAAHRARGGGY